MLPDAVPSGLTVVKCLKIWMLVWSALSMELTFLKIKWDVPWAFVMRWRSLLSEVLKKRHCLKRKTLTKTRGRSQASLKIAEGCFLRKMQQKHPMWITFLPWHKFISLLTTAKVMITKTYRYFTYLKTNMGRDLALLCMNGQERRTVLSVSILIKVDIFFLLKSIASWGLTKLTFVLATSLSQWRTATLSSYLMTYLFLMMLLWKV